MLQNTKKKTFKKFYCLQRIFKHCKATCVMKRYRHYIRYELLDSFKQSINSPPPPPPPPPPNYSIKVSFIITL